MTRLLYNRVRAEFDGSDIVIYNADGSFAGRAEGTGSQPCHECGKPVGIMNRHSKGIYLRGARIAMQHEQPFCSAECRDRWWTSGATNGLFAVDTPATLEWYLCHHCQGGEPYAKLVGVGDVIATQHDSRLQICNQGREVLALVKLRRPHAECDRCNGDRIVSPAPAFFYGRPGDFGYRAQWEDRIDFDRDFTAIVYETNPGEIQVMEYVSETEMRILPELITEHWRFSDPHTFNAWWMEPMTTEQNQDCVEWFRERLSA
jgi:hypothetical protein